MYKQEVLLWKSNSLNLAENVKINGTWINFTIQHDASIDVMVMRKDVEEHKKGIDTIHQWQFDIILCSGVPSPKNSLHKKWSL